MRSENMKNEELIKKYLQYRRDIEKKAIESTLEHNKKALTVLSRTINKPFKDATEADINKYLKLYSKSTYNNRLAIIKPFYKWLFKLDKSDKLPDCIRNFNSIPTKQLKKEATYKERVITEEELAKLIDCGRNPRDRAIFETLYYTGIREGELLSMNTGDAKYDGEFTRVTVRESKTVVREVVHQGRLNELMTYVENYHKYRDIPNKPLWVNDEGNRMGKDGVLYAVKRATKKAGINRKITVHDFRHTSISNDRSKGIPLTHIESKHGLVHGSNMMSVYDHNKTSDYENYLKSRMSKEEKPTYEALQKQKETLERKHEKDIADQKKQIEALKEVLQVVADNVSGLANADLRQKLKDTLAQI